MAVVAVEESKSDNCVQNEHGSCEGIVKAVSGSSTITRICKCPCHDTMYQLIKNTLAVVNQNSNPFQQQQFQNES